MSRPSPPRIARRITRYLEPVPTRADLPTDGVEEGDTCYVSDEMRRYAWHNDEWITKVAYDEQRRSG